MKKCKKSYFKIMPFFFTSALGSESSSIINSRKIIKGNLWLHKNIDDFGRGKTHDTVINCDCESGITLERQLMGYKPQGSYTSDIIFTPPFNSMVLSWNADTPSGTSINIEARVLVKKGGKQLWTNWLSFGTWSTAGDRGSALKEDASDNLAYVDTDTLKIRGTEGETANALMYRITLNTQNPDKSPAVRLVAGTLKNIHAAQEITDVHPENDDIPDLRNLDKDLDVPTYSQYLRDPEIANSICSPTSITMILNYHGVRLLPEEAAWGVYDSVYEGFGNWPFNTAYAASLGFTSYVKYCCSLNDLKQEIYMGFPAAVSVKYRNSEAVNAEFPVIHGAPISKTGGHIIVVRGFTLIDSQEYVIVNDPAAGTNEGVWLKYLSREFDEAWKSSGRIAYIIHN